MRKKNSVSEFTSERNLHLLESFRKSIARQSEISLANAFHHASEQPAPRFWVSERRAAIVIGRMLAGETPTLSMNKEKRELYEEIYSRFLELRALRPDESIYSIIFEIVNRPAPRTYISDERARSIVYEELRKRRMERRGV